MFTFLKGLNDPELRTKGLDLVEKNPPGCLAITMLDMMNRLSAIEQMQAQHMQSQLQAATTGGVPTDELLQLLQQQQRLNKGGKAGSSSSSANRARFGESVANLVEAHYPTDISKQQQLFDSYALHIIDPDHPDAMCYQHGHGLHHKRSKPHTNKNCSHTKHPAKQQQIV
jgi:hypothetical protein